MKKFKFTLQTVHNVREMRQEKEQMILMQKRSEVERAAERVAQIEKTRLQSIEKYTRRLSSGERLDAMELELSANHIASLDRLQREAQIALEQAEQIASEQSKRVAAVGREVKITEKLRETQQLRHKNEVARNEQNALDEIVSANFAGRIS